MSASSQRNILLGILALQMDFISRDELIEAINDWVVDKRRPLDEILLQHNALRKDTLALLRALLEKHVEMHSGDAEQSLAALSSIGSLRGDLESIDDVHVRTILSVVSKDSNSFDPNATETLGVRAVDPEGQRFRILRPHAKGGLGEVSVAHDSELNREVAIKVIQQPYADDPNSRARFMMEAEITGGLEHPGVVPVYGLGQYADGRPFYAMRFIRGDSLREMADRFHWAGTLSDSERSMELRRLLGRFIDVCQAIEYAHKRGVLHRDLKPGNIMIGKYGETLVVDWGLAKAVGRQEEHRTSDEATLRPAPASGSSPTQIGSAIGTPAYMSPEQAAGRLDDLGPASDVYSLGATLYYILTGQPPFTNGDLGAILRRAQAGDVPRPRHVNTATPKSLEAICLKAMCVAPEGRYKSPQNLADDVERWLADAPVSARRESALERLRRVYRRHALTMTLGTCFVLLSLLMLLQSTAAAIRISAIRCGAENELRIGLRRLSDSLLDVATFFPVLFLVLLPFFINTGVIWLIMRWSKPGRVSFLRAAGALLLTGFISLNPRALQLIVGWSEITAGVVSMAVSVPIVLLLLKQMLNASFIRICLVLVAVCASNYVTALCCKTWFVEAFTVNGNAMAPNVLGAHHKGSCSACGKTAYGTHRADFEHYSRRICALCDDETEDFTTKSGDDRKGICHACMQMTEMTDVEPVPREGDRVILNKLKTVERWDIVLYSYPEDPAVTFMHRVVGLPGETVTIVDGKIRINGQQVAVPSELEKLRYLLPSGLSYASWATGERPALLADDEYFVLGDFSMLSKRLPAMAGGNTES